MLDWRYLLATHVTSFFNFLRYTCSQHAVIVPGFIIRSSNVVGPAAKAAAEFAANSATDGVADGIADIVAENASVVAMKLLLSIFADDTDSEKSATNRSGLNANTKTNIDATPRPEESILEDSKVQYNGSKV